MRNTSKLTAFFKKQILNLIDFLFPPQCPYCDALIQRSQIMCDTCFHKIHFITGPICARCGWPLPITAVESDEKMLCAKCLKKRKKYDKARAVFFYDTFSRFAILKFKNADRTDLRRFFVHYMLQAGQDLFEKTDIVLPVPMYWTRKAKRKYNQAAILAEEIARKIHKPYATNILVKVRNTHSQENKSGLERIKNVRNAFDVKHKEQIFGKIILLIDDVLTTGSTAQACAKALKKNGAKAVYVLTIARSRHNRY